MSVLEAIFSGLKILLAAVSVLTIYKTVYKAIGFFARARKFSAAKKQHSYAIVICARNEEKVIGNLLDSIAAQRYPSEKVKVFVIADNCTDRTAQICRERGAIVYERTDPKRARKGWALQFGFAQIRRDYGTDCADGFLLFDADNLLHPDFLARINEAFDTGEYDVVCGYRNTKNFASNFISAAYGIHFYRSSMAYHRPRQRLHTSTHLAGTGFVIRAEWLKDGWNWVCLTEDTQFTYEVISRGGKIGYCEAAGQDAGRLGQAQAAGQDGRDRSKSRAARAGTGKNSAAGRCRKGRFCVKKKSPAISRGKREIAGLFLKRSRSMRAAGQACSAARALTILSASAAGTSS